MARIKRYSRSRLISANDDASIALPIEDRISGLPRCVIGSILERLTTREVARTSVLSRRWKHFWDTHHKLVPDQSFCQGLKSIGCNNSPKYLNRVADILTIHEGRLQRFEFYFKSRLQTFNFDLLILMVSRKHVQELVLTNDYRDLDTNYHLPSYLYLCQEQLNHFYMARHPPALEFKGFPKLHTLVLDFFRFSRHFGQIISNLPNLGTMSLTMCMCIPYIKRLPESLHTLSVRFAADFDWSMFRCKTNVTTFVLRWFGCIEPVRQNGMENFNIMTFLDNIQSMESLLLERDGEVFDEVIVCSNFFAEENEHRIPQGNWNDAEGRYSRRDTQVSQGVQGCAHRYYILALAIDPFIHASCRF